MKKFFTSEIYCGSHIVLFLILGCTLSLIFQVYTYNTIGHTYKLQLYKAPLAWIGAPCLITFLLAEQKNTAIKAIAWVSYRACCLIAGLITGSFIFFVVIEN